MVLALRHGVNRRYSNRFSSNPFPLNGLAFYADLWHYDQKGYGTLTNGTGIATPTTLAAGANTVTVSQAGTLIVWLPTGHTGTAASGTMTLTGSPVSLVGGNNTLTTTGAIGTITVTCTDQVVDRSTNAVLGTVTGATWGSQGRTYASGNYITATASALNFTTSDFSVFVWFKVTSLVLTQELIGRGGENADGWYVLIHSSGDIWAATFQAAATQTSASAVAIVANTWTLGGMTRVGASVKLWLNGVDRTISSGTHINPTTSARAVKVGIYDNNSSYPFVGTTGEILVYSRALSAGEIIQIYNATRWRYGV